MKVTISVGGQFHAFYLARELEKRGHLHKLITSFFPYEAAVYGIPYEKIDSISIKRIAEAIWKRGPLIVRKVCNPQPLIYGLFDKIASSRIKDCDICVAFAGVALETLRRTKTMGSIAVVERGSTHVLFQQQILKDEYGKLGIKSALNHPAMICRELKEYDECDFISVPSAFAARTFIERGVPSEKIIQVPYGVDGNEFKQIEKTDGTFRIIYVGNITVRKGVHYLMQAFYELGLPGSELLLIGRMGDDMKPFFRKFQGSYKWMDFLSQEYLYKYYSQGSVFTIMSIDEGLALVQLQAMACGLPVICTTNTGGDEIIQDGTDGFIIPIRSVDALKEKLTYFYENQDVCYSMGQLARKKVQEKFTWDIYGDKIVSAYNAMLSRKIANI